MVNSSGEQDDDESVDDSHKQNELLDALGPGNTYDVNLSEHFDLHDSMFKRRGGFKMKDHIWVLRCFTLYGTVLCYYDNPDIEKADPSRPRGRINIAKEETLVDMHSSKKPGAPTDFLITLSIYNLGHKKKWEICCVEKCQQIKWFEMLTRFNGKPSDKIIELPTLTSESPITDDSSPKKRSPEKKLEPILRGRESIVKDTKDNFVKSVLLGIIDGDLFSAIDDDMIMTFVGINVATYIVRVGSHGIVCVLALFMNLTLAYYFKHVSRPKLSFPAHTYRRRALSTDSACASTGEFPPSTLIEVLDAGSTMSRAMPKDATAATLKEHEVDCVETIAAFSNPEAAYEIKSHTYWNADASVFNLRTGPNYKAEKKKIPSTQALYDLYKADVFLSRQTVNQVESRFVIPKIPGVTDVDTGHEFVPPLLVFCFNLPAEEPSMMRSPTDGLSHVVVLFFTISPKVIEELKDLSQARPAVRLFARWCEHAETDFNFKSRLKALCVLDDVDNLGLPSFVIAYNGKPCLIQKSGTFTRHPTYIEMSVNVHHFSYLARKGLNYIENKFETFILNVGLTIEGREDDELPEALIGGVRMIQLDTKRFKFLEEYED